MTNIPYDDEMFPGVGYSVEDKWELAAKIGVQAVTVGAFQLDVGYALTETI